MFFKSFNKSQTEVSNIILSLEFNSYLIKVQKKGIEKNQNKKNTKLQNIIRYQFIN